jgi:hypothetical protein
MSIEIKKVTWRWAVTHRPRRCCLPQTVASPPHASLKFSLILSISRSLSNLSLGWDEKKRRTRKKKRKGMGESKRKEGKEKKACVILKFKMKRREIFCSKLLPFVQYATLNLIGLSLQVCLHKFALGFSPMPCASILSSCFFNRVFSLAFPCKRSDINRFPIPRPKMLQCLSILYSFILKILILKIWEFFVFIMIKMIT